jgi:hypothetical protein
MYKNKYTQCLSFNIFYYILSLFKKSKAPDTKGVCSSCGQNMENLGAHIDYCIDSKIWKT